MELKDASALAISLMEQHGLFAKGWNFEFDRATKRLGATHWKSIKNGKVVVAVFPHKITLSRFMVIKNDIEEVRQVLLHEIAHALTPLKGHGSEWVEKARSIGYVGKRLSVFDPQAKVVKGLSATRYRKRNGGTDEVPPVRVHGEFFDKGEIYTITKINRTRLHCYKKETPTSKWIFPIAYVEPLMVH